MTDEIMHDHKLDLIMALTGATLDAEATAAAEAEIAACDDCVVELAAQRLAIEATAGAPTPKLTEMESARIRRALRQELDLADPPPAAPAATGSRRWQRLSVGLSAAAVILLVLATAGLNLLGSFGGADSASSEADDSFVSAATTTTARAKIQTPPADENRLVTGADAEGSAGSSNTTPTGTEATESASTSLYAFGESPDLGDIRKDAATAWRVTGNASQLFAYSRLSSPLLEGFDDAAELCVAAGQDDLAFGRLGVPLGSGLILDGEVYIIAYVDEVTGDVLIVAHDVENCLAVSSAG